MAPASALVPCEVPIYKTSVVEADIVENYTNAVSVIKACEVKRSALVDTIKGE